VALKEVLKQAGGDSRPEVRIGVGTPFPCEAPHFIRVLLDILGNFYDRLPARVQLAFGGFLPWKNSLRFPYGAGDAHFFNAEPSRSRRRSSADGALEQRVSRPNRKQNGRRLSAPTSC